MGQCPMMIGLHQLVTSGKYLQMSRDRRRMTYRNVYIRMPHECGLCNIDRPVLRNLSVSEDVKRLAIKQRPKKNRNLSTQLDPLCKARRNVRGI